MFLRLVNVGNSLANQWLNLDLAYLMVCGMTLEIHQQKLDGEAPSIASSGGGESADMT